MKRYYNLGLDIFFERDLEGITFSYIFKDGKLQTKFSVSENILILAEEIRETEYIKQLNRRVQYFSKTFK